MANRLKYTRIQSIQSTKEAKIDKRLQKTIKKHEDTRGRRCTVTTEIPNVCLDYYNMGKATRDAILEKKRVAERIRYQHIKNNPEQCAVRKEKERCRMLGSKH
ncbi:uncharacterized protein LOC112493985 [Cephus cinctus]|uniref:Uncharacterized protein LOC112493985 n=1 Tax=Cephus cinctus TaxID=211228 RepID=A0AAJ7RCE9_CEPCN|nr:uncharacterized protein LOC112493985 [Cephus cinctus]